MARVTRMTDRELRAGAASDPDAAPGLTREWFRKAVTMPPLTKKGIFLRIDPDVLAWFKAQGPRYQTRMNAVLRTYMEAQAGEPVERKAPVATRKRRARR